MTEIVATAHDAHKAREAAAAITFGDDVAIGLRGREFDVDGFLPVLRLSHEVRQRKVGVGAGDEVGAIAVEEVVLDTLSHATQYTDDEPASLAALGRQGVETVQDFLFCVVAHRASVQENSVGFRLGLAGLIARHAHHRGDHLTVGHVHLATVCFYVKFLHSFEISGQR